MPKLFGRKNKDHRISTARVVDLAQQQGITSVMALEKKTKEIDPSGLGASYNSLKRFWNDDTIKQFNTRVMILVCLALNCQPGDILELT